MWTKSACVVLAWSVLIIGVAVGLRGSVRPAPANTRMAGSTTEFILTSTLSAVPAAAAAPSPRTRYVVQDGDTLSSIAARFSVRGGWPALYAANRPVIGPDPDAIRPGTVLMLPGVAVPARYTVVAGDTLSAIAARFGVRGGWPALYAANRRVIGPDPDVIRAGIVLVITQPAASSPPVSTPSPPQPVPPSPPPGSQHRPSPAPTPAPAATGMPQWLKTVLLVAGLIIGLAFLVEPVLLVRRRHRHAAQAAQAARDADTAQAADAAQAADRAQAAETAQAAEAAQAAHAAEAAEAAEAARLTTADPGPEPASGPPAAEQANVVLADYDRLVVTYSQSDDTVYVLRPPDAEPRAILRVARLVLPEGPYRALAEQLGLPASWPIVLADHDRLVVTCNKRDDTVYVLRPPGEDPRKVLRAARLVLPEGSYGELADQLGVPPSWPME
jgi:LysM repeat protein